MKSNPLLNCTLIIRSQAEYSITTQTVVLRCLLEKSSTGQRWGFTDVDALLTALRAELLELETQILPSAWEEPENLDKVGYAPTVPGSAPLPNSVPPTKTDLQYPPKKTTS